MLYVPYMYYENYSDSPVIKEDFWEYWESQAEREVDKKHLDACAENRFLLLNR